MAKSISRKTLKEIISIYKSEDSTPTELVTPGWTRQQYLELLLVTRSTGSYFDPVVTRWVMSCKC